MIDWRGQCDEREGEEELEKIEFNGKTLSYVS